MESSREIKINLTPFPKKNVTKILPRLPTVKSTPSSSQIKE